MDCYDNCDKSRVTDYQRSALYAWENKAMPNGRSLRFDEIAPYVSRVWSELGLFYPPLVAELPKQTRRWAGTGRRGELRFPATGATEKTVLHEIAHAMTSDIEGGTDGHGARFLGAYMRIAAPRLGVSLFWLWASARRAGLNFEKQI